MKREEVEDCGSMLPDCVIHDDIHPVRDVDAQYLSLSSESYDPTKCV